MIVETDLTLVRTRFAGLLTTKTSFLSVLWATHERMGTQKAAAAGMLDRSHCPGSGGDHHAIISETQIRTRTRSLFSPDMVVAS